MNIELDEYEQREYDAWCDRHVAQYHGGVWPEGGAIGGVVSFVITPTGIGPFTDVRCNICHSQNRTKNVHSYLLTNVEEL